MEAEFSLFSHTQQQVPHTQQQVSHAENQGIYSLTNPHSMQQLNQAQQGVVQEILMRFNSEMQGLSQKNHYLGKALCLRTEEFAKSSVQVQELSTTVDELYREVEELTSKVNEFTQVEQERVKERERAEELQRQYDLAVQERQKAYVEAEKWRLESQRNERVAELYKKKFEELQKQSEAFVQTATVADKLSPTSSPSPSPLRSLTSASSFSSISSGAPSPRVSHVAYYPLPVVQAVYVPVQREWHVRPKGRYPTHAAQIVLSPPTQTHNSYPGRLVHPRARAPQVRPTH